MNRNINNNNKKIKNKLKNFREGSDYSVFQEGEKKIFNFHNNFLRDVFGNDYTTIYEVAESWDSDNFNHARAGAEYENDKTHITYRYEHRINKKSGDYYNEWSLGEKFEDNSKATWKLTERPNPKRIENGFNSDFFDERGVYPSCNNPKHSHPPYQKTFREEKRDLEDKFNYLRDKHGYDLVDKSVAENIDCIKNQISNLEKWIQEEKAGIFSYIPQGKMGKENKELKSQLAEVQKQLAEVLKELKKLRNNSTAQNNVELDQQIDYNEKIIRNVKEVPEAEIKEQVQKSEALLKGAVGNTAVSLDKGKENGVGSLPYVIGGSVILAMVGVIGYLLMKNKPSILSDKIKKNKQK